MGPLRCEQVERILHRVGSEVAGQIRTGR
jgi:hypothetical protein